MSNLSHAQKTELLAKMCQYIPHSRMQGIRLHQLEDNEVTLCLPYREELVGNPDNGAIHGGALTVLLDQCLGIAGIADDRVGAHITPTLDMRIDHLGISPGDSHIYAAARVYRATDRVAFVEGIAWAESRDRPIARACGSWVIMRDVDLVDVLKDVPTGEIP